MTILFCKHLNEKILYNKKEKANDITDFDKIYYCPDCKKYARFNSFSGTKCRYSKKLGDISDYLYIGGNK